MPDIRVARRYAEAMIDVAVEQSVADQVGQDLAEFTTLLDAHDGLLRGTLCTPVFSADERTQVLEALLPKLGLHALTGNFLRLVNTKGRLSAIGEITREYTKLADDRSGRVSVRVTTAEPLTQAVADEIRAALGQATGKDVVLDPDVDADLIGGMVVRVGGKVYDTSIRTRLQQVRRALIDAQTPAQA